MSIIDRTIFLIRENVLLILLSVCLLGCTDKYCENILDLDEVEEIELSPLTSDIEIIPIKCSIPMDEIYRMNEYGDYIFMFGNSNRVIYCVQEDTVIAVLNSVGRGYGEYSRINDFTYDENARILYVNADNKILKYSVPSMSFIESFDIDFSTDGMIALNPDELLANCAFYEDESYKEVYRGICVISTIDGSIKRRCFEMEYYNVFSFLTRDLSKEEEDILLSLGGVYENKIIAIDKTTFSSRELDCFSFSSKWRLPKNLIRILRKNTKEFKDKFRELSTYCKGCHYPAKINSELSYWCFPKENKIGREIAVIKNGNKIYRRSFCISGTNIVASPDYVKGNRCVAIIEGTPESIITDQENLSDIGHEIYDVMETQSFNNPVLLSFTIDNGLE